MRRRQLSVLAAATALCACTTLPPAASWPPEDAPAVVRVHDPGTAIGAAAGVAFVGSPVAWDPASCLAVRVRVLWLARLPDHLLRPLTTRTRLLVAEGPAPLEATPLASRGARVEVFPCAEALEAALAKLEADLGPHVRDEDGADPVRPAGITPLDDLAGALPPGISVGIEAHGGGGALTAVRVHRPRPVPTPLPSMTPSEAHLPLDVGFVVRVARPVLPTVGTGAAPAPAREETTGERILLERLPWSDRLFLLALLPSPTVPAGGADAVRPGLAFVIEVGAPPAPDAPGWSAHRLAVAECAGDVARAVTVRASLASEPRTPEENPAPGSPRDVPPAARPARRARRAPPRAARAGPGHGRGAHGRRGRERRGAPPRRRGRARPQQHLGRRRADARPRAGVARRAGDPERVGRRHGRGRPGVRPVPGGGGPSSRGAWAASRSARRPCSRRPPPRPTRPPGSPRS
jgi:hypothetical protein